MQIILFEDTRVGNLKPLVGLKPVYGLTTGFRTLREKMAEAAGRETELTYHLRRSLASCFSAANPAFVVNSIKDCDLLLVNGRMVFSELAGRMLREHEFDSGTAYMQDGNMIFARVRSDMIADETGALPDLIETSLLADRLRTEKLSGFRMIDNLWDLIALHADEMQMDASSLELGRIDGDIHPSAVIVNPGNVSIGKGASVRAGAVIDASEGFVAIGSGAVVEPHTVLMQNVCLAPFARAKASSRIYSNVFVGSWSKAGGEVEDSIIEQFANKQHDGFLGHSYISSWCNLGAGTNTSDLKNNYAPVRIVVNGREKDTGLQFLGLMMGEHSKSSINSMFNTGTVVGTSSNIFGGGFPPKEVPSFSWGGSAGFEPYDVGKALETARTVMSRRQVSMSGEYEAMFRHLAATEGATKVFT
jgi:UDP-N-acetylglucosamine diphosphorylase / glucose-1-phosphate thymidylyltransferase / UDP-N-acetylgalactosamine diphosphorylase / glucosamine-1-phosphate N-acetyltransferase / galactosamine-1-phosphate N-acetyltransferase